MDMFIANREAGDFEIDISTLSQTPSKLPHGLMPFIPEIGFAQESVSIGEPQNKKSRNEEANAEINDEVASTDKAEVAPGK